MNFYQITDHLMPQEEADKPKDPYGAMIDPEVYGILHNALPLVQPWEPLRNNRYTIEFIPSFDIPVHFIHRISRPSYTLHKGWEDIIIDFYDPVAPSISQALLPFMNYCREHGIPQNAPADTRPLFTILINALDPTGVTVSSWYINVQNLEALTWSEFDYDNQDLANIRMRLSVLNCQLAL